MVTDYYRSYLTELLSIFLPGPTIFSYKIVGRIKWFTQFTFFELCKLRVRFSVSIPSPLLECSCMFPSTVLTESNKANPYVRVNTQKLHFQGKS